MVTNVMRMVKYSHAGVVVLALFVKAQVNGFFEVSRADVEDILTAYWVIDCCCWPVKAEAHHRIFWVDCVEEVVENIAVGVHCDAMIANSFCGFDAMGKVFVQGRLTAEENQVGLFVILIEKFEPVIHGLF